MPQIKPFTFYIALAALVVLGSFTLSQRFSTAAPIAQELPGKKIVSKPKEAPEVLEWYTESETQAVRKKIDKLLKRINKRNDFHGSVLVAKKGKILYSNHIGYKDFRKREAIDESSVFQLASVSKQFTAAAVLLLHEKKQLALTDSVTQYFPDFPYKGVTITNLLNHTAGLPNYFWVAEHEWGKPQAPSNTEMMEQLSSSKAQRYFKPGRNFDYSNTAYFVLASIVEKVSVMSFKAFLKKYVFDPLDMKHSYVYSFEKDSITKNQLDGYRLYRRWRHRKIGGTINDAIVGDKNVYSTCQDLFKWIKGLNNEKLLSKASLELMYAPGKTVYNRTIPYGFGFRINEEKGNNKIYHHGKWNGFRTGLTQYIDDDLVVIVLEHTSYEGIAALNKKIRNLVQQHFTL